MKIIQLVSSEDRTFRALLALGEDVAKMTEAANSVRAQYDAIAERHGLPPCTPGIPS